MKSTLVKEKITLESIARSISKLATKEEIAKLATKDELNTAVSKLATKNELTKSIDDLAGAVKKGFDEVNERLDNLAEKSATKTELYETETRLGKKIDVLDDKIEKIYTYIGKMEVRALNVDQIILDDFSPRIRALEKSVGV
jgi:chromosome segregation ATPase